MGVSTVAAGLISVEGGSGAVSETDGSGEGEGMLVVVSEVAAGAGAVGLFSGRVVVGELVGGGC